MGLLGSAAKVGKGILDIPESISVNGVSRTTLNSDGELIAENIDDISKFWEWFGESSVTDNYGRPKKVYHGTDSEFDKFDLNKSDGFWFTDNKDLLLNDSSDLGASGSKIIKPAYLKIDEPDLNGPNSEIEDYLSGVDEDGIENIYDYGTDYSVVSNKQIYNLETKSTLASNPVATAGALAIGNTVGQEPRGLFDLAAGRDALLSPEESAYLKSKQQFDSNFSNDAGYDRGNILPFRTNQETGDSEFATPQMLKGLLEAFYDYGQIPKSGIFNPKSLEELI